MFADGDIAKLNILTEVPLIYELNASPTLVEAATWEMPRGRRVSSAAAGHH